MKKRFFTQLTLTIVALALTAVAAAGEEKTLSLEGTKWKLAGFVDAETSKFEEPDYSMYDPCCTGPKPTPPDMNTDDWFTLIFNPNPVINYLGYLTSGRFSDYQGNSFKIDYTNSTIAFGQPFMWDGPGTVPTDIRLYTALENSQTFELTDTSLKIYYLTGNSDKLEYLLFRPWEPAPSKVHEADRIVRQSESDKNVNTVIAAPEIILSPSVLTAGPSPIAKSAGFVNFYRVGKQVKSASLKIYNASGGTVGKIGINDKKTAAQSKRQVGSWNLKDAKDRPVPEGTYLVKGTIKTADGKSERIALLIGVR